jgi:hypothetical protein
MIKDCYCYDCENSKWCKDNKYSSYMKPNCKWFEKNIGRQT